MNRQGFTMIEMLIVIGIIGLLAFFLVPNLLGAKDRAKEVAVKGVMHSVQLAIESYEMENNIYPLETNVGLASLCKNYLMPNGYIASVPKNPFTGQEYKDTDAAGKIVFSYDDASGKYFLKAFNRAGTKLIQELTNM